MSKKTKRPLAKNGRELCGAKTRSGTPCKNGAMENGRCRMHGGKSTGPPKKNKNARKHGLFAKYLPDETLEIMDSINERSEEHTSELQSRGHLVSRPLLRHT